MPELPAATDLDLRDQVRLLSGRDVWTTAVITGADGEVLVPATRMNDGPHGLRVQRDDSDHLGLHASTPATCFPTAVALASSWDEELVAEVGAAVAREARALGVHLVLGPGLNIKRHPCCGRNFEYFSEDPLVSGRMAAAMVNGIQSQGIGACVKHFAANNAESHRFVADSVVDARTLREIYLSGFEHVLTQARPWAVMTSYNLVNGVQVTEDPFLLTDVLRSEWGFEGLVVSDWGATGDRVAGVRAGMDLEMPGARGLSDAEVLAAVADGTLGADEVARSAQRVLDHVARCPELTPVPETLVATVEDHDALARRAAAAGAVLLANNGVLPLASTQGLAVIGAFAQQPRYQGAGSSLVQPTRVTTLCDALSAAGTGFRYAPGYDPRHSVTDEDLLTEAVEVARDCEVAVVLVGLPGIDESEGFDRDHLRLPAQHDALVRAVSAVAPRTVVVLANGAPVLTPWHEDVDAVLECYLGGQASGGAVADLLLGVAEPGGRLAETFPVALTDVPSDRWFNTDPRQVLYGEGLAVGHRGTTGSGPAPAWPFGHGLSYTRFEWSQVRVDASVLRPDQGTRVTLQVTNIGSRAGSDVVQVYRVDETGAVLRPERELVGFAKVHLAAGESTEVTVDVPARAWAHYDVDARRWQVTDGTHRLLVARSVRDEVAGVRVEVRGSGRVPGPGTLRPGESLVAASTEEFARRFGAPLPPRRPVRPFTRNSTLGEVSATRTGAALRRMVVSRAELSVDADPGTRAMVERSLEELPLRAAAMFSHGALRWPLVDAMVATMNGEPLRAARHLAGLGRSAVSAGLRRARRARGLSGRR